MTLYKAGTDQEMEEKVRAASEGEPFDEATMTDIQDYVTARARDPKSIVDGTWRAKRKTELEGQAVSRRASRMEAYSNANPKMQEAITAQANRDADGARAKWNAAHPQPATQHDDGGGYFNPNGNGDFVEADGLSEDIPENIQKLFADGQDREVRVSPNGRTKTLNLNTPVTVPRGAEQLAAQAPASVRARSNIQPSPGASRPPDRMAASVVDPTEQAMDNVQSIYDSAAAEQTRSPLASYPDAPVSAEPGPQEQPDNTEDTQHDMAPEEQAARTTEPINLPPTKERDNTLRDLVRDWVAQKKPQSNQGLLAALSQVERGGEMMAGVKHQDGSYIDQKLKMGEQEGKDWESEQAKRQSLVQEYSKQKWGSEENQLNRDNALAVAGAKSGTAAEMEKNRRERQLIGIEAGNERSRLGREQSNTNNLRTAEAISGRTDEKATTDAVGKLATPDTVAAVNDVKAILAKPGPIKGFDTMANTASALPGFVGTMAGSAVRKLEGPEAQSNAAKVQSLMNMKIKQLSGAQVTASEFFRLQMEQGQGAFQGDENGLVRHALTKTVKAIEESDARILKSARPQVQKNLQDRGVMPQYSDGLPDMDEDLE